MDPFKMAAKRRTYCNCRECQLDGKTKTMKHKLARNKLKIELRGQVSASFDKEEAMIGSGSGE